MQQVLDNPACSRSQGYASGIAVQLCPSGRSFFPEPSQQTMSYKVLYHLMGQGHLSYKGSEVAQAVWPSQCEPVSLGSGKWHIFAVGHLSQNTFKVTISR